MKLHLRLLTLLLLLYTNCLTAQTIESFTCGTIGEEPNSTFFGTLMDPPSYYTGSVDPEYLASFEPISFNIFFWIINRSDGTGDYQVTFESILENLKVTNEYYKPMGICFVLTGYDYINSDEIYEGATWGEITSYASPNYVKTDAYNVYMPKNLANANGTISGNGVTNYGSNKLAVIQPTFLGHWTHLPGNVISHELGHTMRLYHTWGNNNSSATTQEHVTRDSSSPNYNALTKGDEVHDTPAMVTFRTEIPAGGDIYDVIDPDNCTYMGNGIDELGVPFSITPTDAGNLMAGFLHQCASGFTTGQGIRVREYIDSNPNALFMQALRSENVAVDLYIKDSPEDCGEEPNLVTEYFWNSSDIWIRNQSDYVAEFQNPEYHPTNPNYVYVRITNRGCDTSAGSETVKLYWTKASTGIGWDYGWTGNSFPNNGPLIGNEIGTVTVPVLEPGEQTVLQFPWIIPNPENYEDINTEPWHFCLLARIIAANDPMAVTETAGVKYNSQQNNNIAWKNVTVVDLKRNWTGLPIGGLIMVDDQPSPFNLNFKARNNETGKKIFQEAEVSVYLNNVLLQAWERGGRQMSNMVRRGTNTFIVTGDNAALNNIIHNTNQIGTLNLKFNFLTQEITNKETYIYNVVQANKATNEILGGETYEIRKAPRTLFYAGAQDKQVDKNETVVLSAEPINEPALYNWYDSEGNLIYEGADFTISTDVAKQYKLEVIAMADGYKDYTNVQVNLHPNAITSISPNPSSDEILVAYKLNHGNSAYLSVSGFYGSNTSNNYILDVEAGSTTIDITNYPEGLYTISLITNGEVSDTKTLVKQ